MQALSTAISPFVQSERQALPAATSERRSVENRVPTGVDAEGHSVVSVPMRESSMISLQGSVHSVDRTLESCSAVTQVASSSEQLQHELEQELAVATQFQHALETWLNMAPTISLLRACDTLSPEGVKLLTPNQGVDFSQKKMILNNQEPPIRIAIPDPLDPNKWTSIVPPIIPGGIKVSVPKLEGEGGWEELTTSYREPAAEENQKIRQIFQDAFILVYGKANGENKISQGNEAITFAEVSEIVDDVSGEQASNQTSKAIALTERAIEKEALNQERYQQEVDQMFIEGRGHLESPYLDFLNLLSSSAEFIARGVGALGAGSAMALGEGLVEGSEQGAKAVENFFQEKAPLISFLPPLAALPVLAGANLGAYIRAASSLPGSIKKSLDYFSVSNALTKVIFGISKLTHGVERVLSLMEEANHADEKIQRALAKSFEVFQEASSAESTRSPDFQKLVEKKNLLLEQINQRMQYRSRSIEVLREKITQLRKEQQENAMPTSGPANRTRIRL